MIFSWQLLRDHGRPNLPHLLRQGGQGGGDRASARVRFDLAGADDRELPLIIGLMPVLAKHAIDPDTFEETTFEPPLGSGPYTRQRGQAGRERHLQARCRITGGAICRSIAACGISTPSASTITATATRISRRSRKASTTCARKPIRAAGRPPTISRRCATAAWSRRNSPTACPRAWTAWCSTRGGRSLPTCACARRSCNLFDFEWINHNYFFDLYKRTASYFDGCDLSAHGVPANARERELLKPFPGAVRADIMDGTWAPPVTDGSGRDRAGLRRAFALFAQAGYALKGTQLVHAASGRPFAFEILTTTRDQERLALAFARSLKRAGIDARVRSVDATQFERRRIAFDFDMMQYRWEQSLSPGNEQLFYWGSAAADQARQPQLHGRQVEGGRRHDRRHARAPTTRADFVAATRALDRVLLSGFYVVPLYFPPEQWVARWTRIEHPSQHLAVRLSAGNLVARSAK